MRSAAQLNPLTVVAILAHCQGAFVVAMLSLTILVELYGMLAIFSINYQSFVANTMLMAMGISIEFLVHPVVAYEQARTA